MATVSLEADDMSLPLTHEPLMIFHKFPKLPTEIRLIIWSYSQQPRVVGVEYLEISGCWFSPTESACQPALFAVCKESREVISKEWLPFLPYASKGSPCISRHPMFRAVSPSPPLSFFNPKIDTLYLGDSVGSIGLWLVAFRLGHLFAMPALKELQRLACDKGAIPISTNDLTRTAKVVSQLQHLEMITCIKGDPSWYENGWKRSSRGIITLRMSKEALDGRWTEFKGMIDTLSKDCTGPRSIILDTGHIWRGDKEMSVERLRLLLVAD